MGQDQGSGVADLYGLARVDRERRWTAIVDVALVLSTLGWIGVLRFGDTLAVIQWPVSLVVVAMVVHRALLLIERSRRARSARSAAVGSRLVDDDHPTGVRAA